MKRIFIVAGLLILFAGSGAFLSRHPSELLVQDTDTPVPEKKEQSNVISSDATTPLEEKKVAPKPPEKPQHSLTEPDSMWVVANKQRPLPDGYTPSDLVVPDVRLRLGRGHEQMQISKVVVSDMEEMFQAALKDDVELVFGSGYRSYDLQKQFYDGYVARDGQAAADRYSARPGTSEHQTGLSFDVTVPDGTCHLEICFEDTAQGKWLRDNAHKYGFTLRYRQGKENVTGYQYEPWHFRYVGRELATELFEKDQTLEEYFNLQ